MRRIFTFSMMLLTVTSMMAQQKVKNISVELFGAQNTIGINYDSRLKGNSGLGYRIVIGFGYADNSNLFDENIKGVGMPLEMNYLLGNKHNKLEIGIGTSLGFFMFRRQLGIITNPYSLKLTDRQNNTLLQATSLDISYSVT